jgi:hypothetical protein
LYSCVRTTVYERADRVNDAGRLATGRGALSRTAASGVLVVRAERITG